MDAGISHKTLRSQRLFTRNTASNMMYRFPVSTSHRSVTEGPRRFASQLRNTQLGKPVVLEQTIHKPSLCPGGRHDLIPQSWFLKILLWEMAWVGAMGALQSQQTQKEYAGTLKAYGRLSLQTWTNPCFLQGRRGQWHQYATTEWLCGLREEWSHTEGSASITAAEG